MGRTRGRRVLLAPAIAALGLFWAAQASAFEPLHQYGVGYPIAGNGGLVFASGVALAPDGTVVVSDVSAHRVSMFSQSGGFLRSFGKNVSIGGGTGPEICTTDCQEGEEGTAAGELSAPWGVAAAGGEIYVPELGNARVSVFDLQGHFLRAFGKDVGGPGVHLCTVACVAGTPSGDAGDYVAPTAAAVTAAGELLVADLGAARVNVINPQTGASIRAFGKNVGGAGVNVCTTTCAPGIPDGSPGSLNVPFGLAAGPNNEVFVSEVEADRVSVFGIDGTFKRVLGATGGGAGQLEGPYGVAVDPAGNAFVADTENARLMTFNAAGAFVSGRGFDVILGEPYGAEICTTLCKPGTPEFGVGAFIEPRGLVSDCRGAIYVGMLGRVEKYGEPEARKPPCESNAIGFGKAKKNKKKGTLALDVTVPGAGVLVAAIGKKLTAKIAKQPAGPGKVTVTIKAAGKGIKSLSKSGKLKGKLELTFTPPNEVAATQSKSVTLTKKLKKAKKGQKGGSK